jgi:hypothetical protein
VLINFRRELQIEDLRDHPAEMVRRPQNLPAPPTPEWAGFYDLKTARFLHYIQLPPITTRARKVELRTRRYPAPGETPRSRRRITQLTVLVDSIKR